MKFSCWVLEIKDARTLGNVVPFKGVEHPEVPIYEYTLDIDGGIGDNGIATGTLNIRSSKPLAWRAGQNVTIDIADIGGQSA